VETQLIELYLLICTLYDNQPVLNQQRLSNFKPRFTDQELLTMYLFGHLQGHTTQRRIYDYFARHWRDWFPTLPSYQAFSRRLPQLLAAFELFIEAPHDPAGHPQMMKMRSSGAIVEPVGMKVECSLVLYARIAV
jgi:hypothetical protein